MGAVADNPTDNNTATKRERETGQLMRKNVTPSAAFHPQDQRRHTRILKKATFA
jgi:hypothetical protein